MLNTCDRHSRGHKYEFALEKCEVVPPIHRDSSYSSVKVCGQNLKDVGVYKYLGLPFGEKGLDTQRMHEVSIAKGVRTAGLFYSVGCNGGEFSTAVSRRALTSFVRPSMEYGMALANLSKGQQVAVDKARCQILRRVLSVPVTAGDSAILKVLGVPPMSFKASKLNACFMAHVYDAAPNTLTAEVVSCATDGWG